MSRATTDTTMQISEPMFLSRATSACPYCHQPLGVDADTHIVGCCARWRRQHHVEGDPTPSATPTIARWTMPEPVTATIESPSSLARRICSEGKPQPAGFRSLPAYEPAF